jgi:sugar phosphate isomerase/epimerase
MASRRRFAVSTYFVRHQRLTRDHLRDAAAAGFDLVELFAERTHLDYHSDTAVADLQQWLAAAGSELASVHAPVSDCLGGGRQSPPLNLASADARVREQALEEATLALQMARRLAFKTFVVHLGVPVAPGAAPGGNSRDAARRSVEALATTASRLGVTLAVELIQNELSRPDALVRFVEHVVADTRVSICLDLGHARIAGDVADAIETVSEHIALVHAHDNRGRRDEHLIPFEGTIEWAPALTALQKVGYDGPVVLEVGLTGSTRDTLARARGARARMEQIVASL